MSTLRHNLVSQYGLQIAKYVLPFVSLFVLAHVLGAETYGFRAYVLSVTSMMQVFVDFGFEQSATRHVAESEYDTASISRITFETVFSKIILLIVVTLASALLVYVVPILQMNIPFVIVSIMSLWVNSLIPDYLFLGKEEMSILAYRYIVCKTLFVLGLILLVHSDHDLLLVAYLDLFTNAIALIWTWVSARRKYEIRRIRPKLKSVVAALKESAVYFVSRAANVAYTTLTTVIIGVCIADQSQIAWWSISTTLIGAAQSLYAPLSTTLYPRVIKTKDYSLVKRFTVFGTPIVLLATLVIYLFSDQIMLLVGGNEYIEGAWMLSSLSLLIPLGFYSVMLGWPLLGALGYVKQLTASTTVAAVFHVTGLIVLVATGFFSMVQVVLLRLCTEGILLACRVISAGKNIKGAAINE